VPDQALIRALRGQDPMGLAQQKAYVDAVGAPINPLPMPEALRSNQGVVPIPPNVQGLAKLLMQTGRAPDMTSALLQAQQMTAGR
jgi:hypothetical protein